MTGLSGDLLRLACYTYSVPPLTSDCEFVVLASRAGAFPEFLNKHQG